MNKKTIAIAAISGLVSFGGAWIIQRIKLNKAEKARKELLESYIRLYVEAALEAHKDDPDWIFTETEIADMKAKGIHFPK